MDLDAQKKAVLPYLQVRGGPEGGHERETPPRRGPRGPAARPAPPRPRAALRRRR
jgi:hypothetical protein